MSHPLGVDPSQYRRIFNLSFTATDKMDNPAFQPHKTNSAFFRTDQDDFVSWIQFYDCSMQKVYEKPVTVIF